MQDIVNVMLKENSTHSDFVSFFCHLFSDLVYLLPAWRTRAVSTKIGASREMRRAKDAVVLCRRGEWPFGGMLLVFFRVSFHEKKCGARGQGEQGRKVTKEKE